MYSSTPTSRSWTGQATQQPSTRPRTAQSRPGTGRPTTSASERCNGSWAAAILEGRGIAREVGLAALERDTGQVILVQFSDTQTYAKTLHQLCIRSPSVLLVPDTSLSAGDASFASGFRKPPVTSILVRLLEEEFSVPIEPVMRKYWNDTAGLDFVKQLCVDDDERAAIIMAILNKYYALSAVSALFKYCETKFNTRYAAASLRIRYLPFEGTMMIDSDTVRNLELACNMTSKRSAHSLFGILNHTNTAMGARLLRVNILSPSTDLIETRLNAVEELINSEDKFTAVRDALKTMHKMDFDKLITSLAISEARELTTSAKVASTRVSEMLNLRNLVKSLPLLQTALAGSRSRLLQDIYEFVSDKRLGQIEDLVRCSLNEDAAPLKGGLGAINSRVYAVKANHNRLLDVARETYKENVGDIFQLKRLMSEEHGLALTLVYQESGFVFALQKSELEGTDKLPKDFVNVMVQKGRYLFSSMELKKRNARMKDALDETLILSDAIIQDLVSAILVNIGALYKASEAMAQIDMLSAFAHVSILRPEFTGTLAVKAGRHPILEGVQAAGMLVPNDVYCCGATTFQMVHGPNMSGKSTYLRQIGLLTIMGMAGSFVPAQYASFRVHDALLTRLSNDDDAEKSLSTFANEMASSAMILGLATADSLVLIDELGRGTSPRDGVGISHAIAESLIKTKCFTFFATHFHELTMTLSRQPSVVNLHLSVQRNRRSNVNFGMTYQYKILDGAVGDYEHYGLDLARLADLPPDVIDGGRAVAVQLTKRQLQLEEQSRTTKIFTKRQSLLKLKTQLTQALEYSALPDGELAAHLSRLQKNIADTLRRNL
ncbi:hypothetical protein PUNSTDRAFT_109550 [Punctularia strigosozonata HHB-11173 SS5]|uniref:uncharacterized protein n=1 Tax=Punctularia strigosozonata (strain HHB-11173) TaxID=741275 RepID=UPI000441670E|nr:uncharacterized protein PUNSTDRAFT_109550 [Punctularia strigosozonata HHB-11173 SS5]EIN13274.1 hypothetical protein PUNSTDRAFT_109550 [Punctularia strigosozonata HHB-11173 SS5]